MDLPAPCQRHRRSHTDSKPILNRAGPCTVNRSCQFGKKPMIPGKCKRLAEVGFPDCRGLQARCKGEGRSGTGTRPPCTCGGRGGRWPRRGRCCWRCCCRTRAMRSAPEAFKQAARAQLPPVGCSVGETDEDLRARPIEVYRSISPTGRCPPILPISRQDAPWCGRRTARRHRWWWTRLPAGGSIPLEALRPGL